MKPLSRRDVAVFWSCWRKKAWDKKAAYRLAKINGQRPYHCENCDFYHLTKREAKR